MVSVGIGDPGTCAPPNLRGIHILQDYLNLNDQCRKHRMDRYMNRLSLLRWINDIVAYKNK